MMDLKVLTNIVTIGFLFVNCSGQAPNDKESSQKKLATNIKVNKVKPIQVGAENTAQYISLLQHKKVGVVANHSSMIHNTHLVDSLIALQININKIFSPEHGFRGIADAGEKVASKTDAKTGLPIVSLYGKNKKPAAEQIKGLDVIIFDIQDVGARFYTYISTMHYVMEACATHDIEFIVLDRPNPNGHFLDGPVLEKKYESFVGMHPVPIVHGMTIGEYSQMINGESWLKDGLTCNLTVVKCNNYTHKTRYKLPVKPSPNLPNMSSVYLYPSLCLFEATPISIGRGTDKPFQIVGHPSIKSDKYSFTPKSKVGAKTPKLLNETCYGYDLSEFGSVYMKGQKNINLFWLIDIYNRFPEKEGFFSKTFNYLSGTAKLKQQIIAGKTEEEIRASWQKDLDAFKQIRKKYLLYEDFE